MENSRRHLGLEDREQEEHTKPEKGGMIAGMFRRSPKPADRSLAEQDSLSARKGLSAGNDKLSASNDDLLDIGAKEKGGMIAGMFRRSPKPADRSLAEQDSLSARKGLSAGNDKLSASNDDLLDIGAKEKGGMFSGMFKSKTSKHSKDPTAAQDNLSTHSELTASNDSLSENNNTKEKGGLFSGMFKSKTSKHSKDPAQDNISSHSGLSASNDSLSDNNDTKEKGGMFSGMFKSKSPKHSKDAQDNVSTHPELSASYDSLSDIGNTKEKGEGSRRVPPKPAPRPRPVQDSMSLHSDLSLSCEDLTESSKPGFMEKIRRNPFRSVAQDRDKDRDKSEPELDSPESSPPTARRSKTKQNGVMNGILKNPFRSGHQEKEQDSDSEEKATGTEHQPKHKPNAVVGAISKLNPFRSASKESDQKPMDPPPAYENMLCTNQESEPKADLYPPTYEDVVVMNQTSDYDLQEPPPIYEDVIPMDQGASERAVEAPRARVPKKGKKARNPFLPAKGTKARIRREPRAGDSSVDPKPAEGGEKGKPWSSRPDDHGGVQPEMTREEEEEEEEEDGDGLMEWWNTVEQWDDTPEDEDLTEKEEAKAFAVTADKVQKAIRVFNKLFTERAEGLWQHVIDLRTIADGIDTFNKKTKIAAITGGSTSALGGVATITGLALAPVTMGTSLIVTAVGLAVATAGGLTSASASISNTVNNSLDRKKVEKIVEDYQAKMADISKCMKFIKQGIENLRKYDVVKMKNHAYNQDFPVLTNIYEDGAMASKALLINTGEIMRVVQIANVAGSTAARAVQIASLATGVLTGLFVGMDIYFVAKDSRELKKGAKTEFAAKIREVAEQLHEGLVELNTIREELQEASRNSII
ncbi:hypothetical protein COCON_G00137410 [Conger conger]|uniref:Apolipoprotein L, 1 n=1 Tax=Conger conger TaxID=82655 RepID=A0A9Q1HY25_CONCO|nr:hypothetical protein COCON_G00137410 [Conger conger]